MRSYYHVLADGSVEDNPDVCNVCDGDRWVRAVKVNAEARGSGTSV
jgi:hypothetical protein